MWREHDSGLMCAGDVGGDNQVGKGWSKRFVRTDSPGSLLTVSIYPIGHSEGDTCVPRDCRPGQIDLEAQVEYMICTDPDDPGGTEVWSDYLYISPLADIDGSDLVLKSVETAEERAKYLTSMCSASAIVWDGVTQNMV
jgi:hypothetical protein